jgi:hypothetical protein
MILRLDAFFVSASVSATMSDRMRFAPGAAFSTALDGLGISANSFFSFMAFKI